METCALIKIATHQGPTVNPADGRSHATLKCSLQKEYFAGLACVDEEPSSRSCNACMGSIAAVSSGYLKGTCFLFFLFWCVCVCKAGVIKIPEWSGGTDSLS